MPLSPLLFTTMIENQNQKIVVLTPPAAIVDNAAFTTATLDTLGWAYCTIYCVFGAMDIAMAALKVQESNDSGMSGAADVTGLVYGTSALADSTTTSSLPSATSDNTVFAFDISLNGRKRYLDVSATGGDGSAGTYLTIFAVLSRGKEVPNSASERGLAAVLRA